MTHIQSNRLYIYHKNDSSLYNYLYQSCKVMSGEGWFQGPLVCLNGSWFVIFSLNLLFLELLISDFCTGLVMYVRCSPHEDIFQFLVIKIFTYSQCNWITEDNKMHYHLYSVQKEDIGENIKLRSWDIPRTSNSHIESRFNLVNIIWVLGNHETYCSNRAACLL